MDLAYTKNSTNTQGRVVIILITISGLVALSWQVLWQIKTSLALGVSAWGTAITLAVTMGGMSLGAFALGYILEKKKRIRPLRLYGILELTIGISGFFLNWAFKAVEQIDTAVYQSSPDMAPLVYILGIASSFGLQALCLGATIPVIALLARQTHSPISRLYGLNTLGAAAGALITAFLLIPALGVTHSIWLSATLNITIGLTAIIFGKEILVESHQEESKISEAPDTCPSRNFFTALLIVSVTGCATFMLEIAWFRALTAAFMSTTDAFAIMLASILVALGLGARLVPYFKSRPNTSLGYLLAWSGITILLVTPIIERFDIFIKLMARHELIIFVQWFFITLYVTGIPIFLLGLALPWILDSQNRTWKWGTLYGMNACASIFGAIISGWILLPTIGLAQTAWIAGILVASVGILTATKNRRLTLAAFALISLSIAMLFESGLGRLRIQGASDFKSRVPTKILAFYEGPDSTISAVEYEGGRRILFIDGFSTTEQDGRSENRHMPFTGQYMAWMGHLPMLLHPNPQNALVICFGTGQTANAVRKEEPKSLDIVDINPNVFKMADNFWANEKVLEDPRVSQIVMDGRAFMRRTKKTYDIITLEPMPPNFAGVNALYSQEFYKLAKSKLSEEGVIAQWLPYHLVPAEYSASIARTFYDVFPNAILWNDPASQTGILLGSVSKKNKLGDLWPGLERNQIKRSLLKEEIISAIILDTNAIKSYAELGKIITDDNQLLSYGKAAHLLRRARNSNRENQEMIYSIIKNKPEATE